MKIQSAGRLGNILFIWAYALTKNEGADPRKVTIFADKYHSKLNADLNDIFSSLNSGLVAFETNNRLGFLLKSLDKVSSITPRTGQFIRKFLRIQVEGQDVLTNEARILRGFFQSAEILSRIQPEVSEKLEGILQRKNEETNFENKFAFLKEPYQAIHVRLTDYVGSEFGVIDPNSQVQCLQSNLNVVICTDGSVDQIASRINISNYTVLTPENTTAWETLAILSRAENVITTNSTLSWWSGFLALNRGKSVWIPEYWNPALKAAKHYPLQREKTYVPIFE